MSKYLIAVALTLSGCSYFTFNATMCDQIASEPNAVMPQECQNYDEKKADKAFHKIKNEKRVSDKDIKFNKDEDE